PSVHAAISAQRRAAEESASPLPRHALLARFARRGSDRRSPRLAAVDHLRPGRESPAHREGLAHLVRVSPTRARERKAARLAPRPRRKLSLAFLALLIPEIT